MSGLIFTGTNQELTSLKKIELHRCETVRLRRESCLQQKVDEGDSGMLLILRTKCDHKLPLCYARVFEDQFT